MPIVTLPGNPVSVFVSWHCFVVPLLNRLVGRDAETATRWTRAVAGQDWRSPAGRRQYIPVARLDNDLVVPTHRLGSGSHLIASLHLADGLAVIPADVDQVTAGDRVDVLTTRCWR